MKAIIIFLLMLLVLNAKENSDKNSSINSKNLDSLSKISDKNISDTLDIKKLKSNKVYTEGNSKLENNSFPKDRLNLVHIVKKVGNTTVEYWVDPYAENVNVDLKFTDKVPENKKDVATDNNITKDANITADNNIAKDANITADNNIAKDANITADNNIAKDGNITADNNITKVSSKELTKSIDSYLSNYENAHAYFYKKKYNKAHLYIEKAIAINSNVSYGYRFEGTIYYREKNYEKALEAWKRAVALNPTLEDVKQYIHKLESN